MFTKYNETFDILVDSYCNSDFDDTFIRIIGAHDKSPQDTFAVVSSLCGVNIPYNNYYLENIKDAIQDYNRNQKIVEKITDCHSDCTPNSNGNFPCQESCGEKAILYNANEKKVYIDHNLCIDCGNCISHCSYGSILDKIQFLPIMNCIRNNSNVTVALDPNILKVFTQKTDLDIFKNHLHKLGFSKVIDECKEDCLTKDSSCDTLVYITPSLEKKKRIMVRENSPASSIDFVLTYEEIDEVLHILKVQ